MGQREMKEKSENWTDRYLLRHLAGRYFLIRKGVDFPEYVKPIEMDEAGAAFWHAINQNPDNFHKAAEELSVSFGVSVEKILPDVVEFCQTVKQKMEGDSLRT